MISFKKNISGNVSVMFGATAMSVLMAAGAAIDYNGMVKQRRVFQGYADSAVLAASRSGETKMGELQKIAAAFVDANNVSGLKLKTQFSMTKDGHGQVQVTGDYDTVMMGLFGKKTAGLDVVAEAPMGAEEPVHLSLVLDVTASMSGTKMSTLQTAATELVTQLESLNSNSLQMSVVPFSQYVNIGLSRRTEIWLDVAADTTTAGVETCYMKKDQISKSGCTTTTSPTSTCYNDGVPYSCGGGTYETCTTYEYGPEYEYCYTPSDSTSSWNGCVGSRIAPYHLRAEYGASQIPGLHNVSCPVEIQPLTADLTAIKSTISSLSASGNTYIPSGLVWGWRTLDVKMPLTEAAGTASKNPKKVMILMTDGANTLSKVGTLHSGSDAADANDITKKMCNEIKADKIDIYTIAYEVTDFDVKSVLRNCATSPSNYFDASNAAALKEAFKKIGAMLIKVRLSH